MLPYRFSDVTTKYVDAIVTIDSLVNGAKVNKIDDNSNGVGYVAFSLLCNPGIT
ncbi:MAG: hypothetical protein IPN39_16065 [Chitinophagaceae bacterium]|nr:hypothetical protein [Chitinophagaceae bacterium]